MFLLEHLMYPQQLAAPPANWGIPLFAQFVLIYSYSMFPSLNILAALNVNSMPIMQVTEYSNTTDGEAATQGTNWITVEF